MIVLSFMLSLTFSMTLFPNACAHSPTWSIPTYAYINAEPNPIGVGQSMIIYMWLDPVYGDAITGGGTRSSRN